ncbi:hypothetical protein BLNAU_19943 [Blattamonas nauphoetae]|uniref:Uncharacterized protein n=1 Tax=Blattamonas nauphoetae TaxID=2049346 RepID=A0ABQ9X0Q1_9EUKA|nr:hypothetical protein BLNAU_19943 [Blattamonas nauphoetae]
MSHCSTLSSSPYPQTPHYTVTSREEAGSLTDDDRDDVKQLVDGESALFWIRFLSDLDGKIIPAENIATHSIIQRDIAPQSSQEGNIALNVVQQDLEAAPQHVSLRSLSQTNPSTIVHQSQMVLRERPPRTSFADYDTSIVSPPLEAPVSGGGDFVPDDPPFIITTSDPRFNEFLESLHQGEFVSWNLEEMERTVVRGEFILFHEHRLLPCDKRTTFRYFTELFPDNRIPEYKMYRLTKAMVHQASIRTDVCSVCVVGEQLRSQGRKLSEEIRQELTLCIRRHNEDNIFQRIQHNADIADLQDDECVLVADFKENINLPIGRTQVGESFYSRAPVQMLTFVLFRRVGVEIRQRVFTTLSRTLSKSSSFVIHALQTILRDEAFSNISTLKWWSDGAPHFHSREFVSFLLLNLRIHNREIETQVNFFFPQHGKNCCDRVFAKYSKLLSRYPSPINDFSTLIQILRKEANRAKVVPHVFLDCSDFMPPTSVHFLPLEHFKMSLFFSRSHDKIYAAPISDTTMLKLSSIAVVKTKAKRLTTKLSTVPDTMTDAFEDEVRRVLKQLHRRYPMQKVLDCDDDSEENGPDDLDTMRHDQSDYETSQPENECSRRKRMTRALLRRLSVIEIDDD